MKYNVVCCCQTDTDQVLFVQVGGCSVMVLISSYYFYSLLPPQYVCMCDFSMRVCFLMWWFCWFGHRRGEEVVLVVVFTVSFKLTNRLIVNINNIILLIYILYRCPYCYFRYYRASRDAKEFMFRVLFVLSYALTIMVMSSCSQPTECWLQTGISVNFKQYEGFYSGIHAFVHIS